MFLDTELDMRSSSPDPVEFIEWSWHAEQEIDEMIRLGEIVQVILLAAWRCIRIAPKISMEIISLERIYVS